MADSALTPWRRALAWLAGAALLTACSTADLAYRNADWLLLRYANGYLDLDAHQEARLASALEVGLVRHRRSELPRVVAFLREARDAAADGLARAEAEALIERLRALWRATAELGVAAASPVLASLTPHQIAHLEARLAEANDEYIDDYLAGEPGERQSRRAERFVERIETWTGPLAPGQRALVARHVRALPDTAQPWYAYRAGQQGRLLAALRAGASVAAIETLLREWWVEQQGRSARLEALGDELLRGTAALLVALDATLDSSQRAHLLARLDGYAEDFADLVPAASPDGIDRRAHTSSAMASAAVSPGDSIP